MPQIPMAAKPLLSIKDMSITFSSPDEADIEAVRQVDLTLTPEDLARIDAVFPKGAASGHRYAEAARAALNR